MPVIYLRHKEHGEKVACDNTEADADKERGWEIFDPYATYKDWIGENPMPSKAPEAAVDPPKRRRGRPRKEA